MLRVDQDVDRHAAHKSDRHSLHGSDALPPAQRRLASDPVQLAGDLVADEQALRDPSSSEAVLMGAARRQQAAYRALGGHSERDGIVRPRIPPSLLLHLRPQRRRATAAHRDGRERIEGHAVRVAHRPARAGRRAARLLPQSGAATGGGWNYLAAINLVETGLGRIVGVSDAGAQGPMQFLPSTFAEYGDGGDILSVLLPIGYAVTSPIPVTNYLATHPQ